MALAVSPARADEYTDTVAVFKNAGESGKFFTTAYGYAVFPTIVKGAFIVGGARGAGRVYAKGQHVGDSTMTQATVGLQIGGEGYSEIVFFQDERAFKEFTNGNFEFGAGAQAVVVTAAAQGRRALPARRPARAQATITRRPPATITRAWRRSSSPKGGLIAGVSVGGQKFSYTRL